MQTHRYQTPITEVIELQPECSVLITSDPLNNPNSGYDPLNDLGVL